MKMKSTVASFLCIVFLSVLYSGCKRPAGLPDPAKLKNKYNVHILRDSWGVPHICGEKDTDTAFGLAYAHARDDFKTIQLIMAAINGRFAQVHLIRL